MLLGAPLPSALGPRELGYVHTSSYQSLTGACSSSIDSPAFCPTSWADTMVTSGLRKPSCKEMQRLQKSGRLVLE